MEVEYVSQQDGQAVLATAAEGAYCPIAKAAHSEASGHPFNIPEEYDRQSSAEHPMSQVTFKEFCGPRLIEYVGIASTSNRLPRQYRTGQQLSEDIR